MPSQRYTPAYPLGQFIQCFWYWEGILEGAHTHERLMPNGEATIVFNLRDEPIRIYRSDNLQQFDTYGHAVLSGARTDYFVIDTVGQERVLGIQFQPGGAFPFFREPADAMENTSVTLEDLWRTRVEELRERMLSASSISAIFHILEQDLLAQLARPLAWHPAVNYALNRIRQTPHGTTITSITDQIGLSPRRFIQLFRQQVGLTPKAFSRVRRFQQVIQAVHGIGNADWTQIALDCGYYDQPHFIHDFQSFSGVTPSAYLAAATMHMNHVPIV